MARRLSRLRRLLRRSADVQEGAACTRALVGLIGNNSLDNWMETVQLSQGLLTSRWWQSQINVRCLVLYPNSWIQMAASFLPPSSVLQSMFSREYTVLSDGGAKELSTAHIDPWVWIYPLTRSLDYHLVF